MAHTVYTNYWINERSNVRKEHGSYATEEEAVAAIKTWWEIHREKYRDVQEVRTNTGALEIYYGDPNYYYRIESRQREKPLPSRSYRLKTPSEIDALRKRLMLDDESYLFDELSEPYRDRLALAFGDIEVARKYSYTQKGQPIIEVL